jgi:phospholipid/cholesterol/gamma-HCH transport system substrate-binding protein
VKRLAAILVMFAAGTVLVLGTGAGNGGSYQVRAIFDNAFAVVSGEDVKIAGVRVGKVDSLDVTPQQKAAVVLQIDNGDFQDFRADASCTIRPQSLIGEKFVECKPTEPRTAGESVPPPLPKIKHGDGAGQRLIPLEHNSSPVDLDLINNIARKPYADRLSIILGELGTAVAGRGQDLNQAIRRADPALQQTDRVLKIVADQNRQLADLARDSDAVIAPLARDRARVSDSIVQSNTVAQATAQRGADLERTFQRLPPFLTELRPTMQRLGALSDQATPVLSDLGAVAPSINSFFSQLGPFSEAATPALRTLGDATDFGTPALIAARPIIGDLRTFAGKAKPVGANLGALTQSLQRTGGVERLMDYLFYTVSAINGFDQFGHYLRAALILTSCTDYVTDPSSGCSANFGGSASTASTRAASARTKQPPARSSAAAVKLSQVALPGTLGQAQERATPATPAAEQPAAPAAEPSSAMLNYLLGP